MIREEEKQRPPKTYGKLRTWCFSKCIPPPPAHELLVVNEKATRQLQEHTKRVEQPARGTCELSGFGMVLSPGHVPETPPPLPGVPPPTIPAGGHRRSGAYLCFLDLLVSARGGDVAEQQVVREENGKGKTNESRARAGKKGTGLGGTRGEGKAGKSARPASQRGSAGSDTREGEGNEEGKPWPLMGRSAARRARPGEEREERARRGGSGRGRPEARIPTRERRRRGSARSGGPGPSRAPSRLTQWPRHAGWACTCSKRLLADMALGSSLVTSVADSSSARRRRRMSPGGRSRGRGGGFCP